MILLIDNYDSFTYNLYQYMGIFRQDIEVVRNDKITIEEVHRKNPDRIVLSPGPKSPAEAGICMDVVKHFYDKLPILGICLGHQSIGAAFGANIVHAKELMHGKQSSIVHEGKGIFAGVPSPMKVARYHSLAVDESTLPSEFEILAKTEDGEIMAMEHREYPLIGIQFHPESIYTDHGKKIIENFLEYDK
ncbi:MAG: aminodeoxychorismate/anthranilate synthase component II [Eubacteriales bacterium]|nr:aminodeoxychorismate/anthranilate synthase component II [Eubacteriales bacterium]